MRHNLSGARNHLIVGISCLLLWGVVWGSLRYREHADSVAEVRRLARVDSLAVGDIWRRLRGFEGRASEALVAAYAAESIRAQYVLKAGVPHLVRGDDSATTRAMLVYIHRNGGRAAKTLSRSILSMLDSVPNFREFRASFGTERRPATRAFTRTVLTSELESLASRVDSSFFAIAQLATWDESLAGLVASTKHEVRVLWNMVSALEAHGRWSLALRAARLSEIEGRYLKDIERCARNYDRREIRGTCPDLAEIYRFRPLLNP
jgi:hypothetical protein